MRLAERVGEVRNDAQVSVYGERHTGAMIR